MDLLKKKKKKQKQDAEQPLLDSGEETDKEKKTSFIKKIKRKTIDKAAGNSTAGETSGSEQKSEPEVEEKPRKKGFGRRKKEKEPNSDAVEPKPKKKSKKKHVAPSLDNESEKGSTGKEESIGDDALQSINVIPNNTTAQTPVKKVSNVLLPKLTPEEVQFLELVATGELPVVEAFQQKNPNVNVNCVNFQGLTALHMAVQSRSDEMVEYLLKQKDIDISDTVLYAVKDGNLKIMTMLLDAQKRVSPALEFAGVAHSTNFPLYVTPLVLAAQNGHYEAVELLVSRGHKIVRPHPPDCNCPECKKSRSTEDPLYRNIGRFALYRAIASPVFLVHTSEDPILIAFKLSAELSKAAEVDRQMAEEYLGLKDEVSKFAVDLMSCCRSSEEVELLLKQTTGSQGKRHFVLPRLLLAMDYKQKHFVAHPNTQLVLEKYWIGTWVGWRGKPFWHKAVIVLTRIFITPAILVMSIVLPASRFTHRWQLPINKLITHASSYCAFLVIVFIISNRDRVDEGRGPPNTGLEAILVVYVMGFTWSLIRSSLVQGPRRYFRELWNWSQLIMLGLFYTTFILWLVAAADAGTDGEADLERKYWDEYEPTLLAEGTFCVATILAFFRLMFLCQLNSYIGPLQVSLGKMTVDIYRYLLVFAILIMSFAAGLSKMYQYYDGMIYVDEAGEKTIQESSFVGLKETVHTLFWAIFCMAPLEAVDVIIENIKDENGEKVENKHGFTQAVGYFTFAVFEVLSVIVVLNMLIATMSNTFQHVIDNAAVEWTFGKTEVYVDYMTQTALPPPLNLIPTASGFHAIAEWFLIMARRPKDAQAKWSLSQCCYVEKNIEEKLQKDFPMVMSSLVQRYFVEKENNAGGEANEIEALRSEINSLRTMILDLNRCVKKKTNGN